MKISVIIPTLNAAEYIDKLLTRLEAQTVPPDEIIVIDSGSDDDTLELAEHYASVRTMTTINFNHGTTRDRAAKEAVGDVLIFMTQDAVPYDRKLIENLVGELYPSKKIAAVYARQLPRKDATPQERLVRMFNYPVRSYVHDADSAGGLKKYFLSNVCAAYRRDVYDALGGFEHGVRTNEDMLFAARAVKAGYGIAYASDAKVIHSHNLSLREQFARNRVQGYELARHADVLGDDSPVAAGKKMFAFVVKGLLRRSFVYNRGSGSCSERSGCDGASRRPCCTETPHCSGRSCCTGRSRYNTAACLVMFTMDCAARFAGNRLGKLEWKCRRK